MSTFSHISRFCRKKPRGFTLIELMVVTVIIVVITATILIRQERFNSSTLLRSLTYGVALSVRSAQVYGTSVRESTLGVFAPAHGVYFSSGNFASYTVFADNDNNGVFSGDSNGNGVCDIGEDCIVKTYTLGKGTGTDYRVKKFCAFTASGVSCSDSASPNTLTWMTIMFRRPNPDACVATNLSPSACALGGVAAYQGARIQLQAVVDPNNTFSVLSSTTGQIIVGPAGS